MDEGEFAQVSCIVSKGDQPLSISWFFHGSHITPDLGIVTAPIGSRGSMLIIGSVAHKHRGNYTCSAKNLASTEFKTVELRVNGTTNMTQNIHRKALRHFYHRFLPFFAG